MSSSRRTTVRNLPLHVILVVVGIAVAVFVPRLRRVIAPRLADAGEALRVLRTPTKVVELFAGNFVTQVILAIVTIGLVFIGQHIWFNVAAISGGPGGRAFPAVQFGSFDFSPGQQLSLGGLVIDHNGLYYYLALFLLALAMLYVWNVSRSRVGRAMQAVREREMPAAVMGVDLARTKVSAFVISSSPIITGTPSSPPSRILCTNGI